MAIPSHLDQEQVSHSDPIVRALKLHGILVTRRSYLALSMPGQDPDNLDPELELELPVELRASFDPGE